MIINHHKTTYVLATGEIEMVMGYSAEDDAADPEVPEGRGLLDGKYPHADWYVVNSQPTARPDMPTFPSKDSIAPDGVDLVQFDNVPVGALVSVEGVGEYIVTDGMFGFSTENAGAYTITISLFPYTDLKVGIYAG